MLPAVFFDGSLTSTKNVYIAKIISFDDPGPTGVESGLAELIKPQVRLEKNNFIFYSVSTVT